MSQTVVKGLFSAAKTDKAHLHIQSSTVTVDSDDSSSEELKDEEEKDDKRF